MMRSKLVLLFVTTSLAIVKIRGTGAAEVMVMDSL